MHKMRKITSGLVSFFFLFLGIGLSQQHGPMGDGHFDPDSLVDITVTGTAIVDTTYMNHMYFLDETGDGEADYFLNFGPYWYEPDSGNAVRPQDGQIITIDGGLAGNGMYDFPTIVVYNINGEFWRDPSHPFWNDFGGYHHGGGHSQGGCNDYTGGWMQDTLEIVTLNGTALVDTTFYYSHYYLDENGDSEPDYFLNFGPPWYEPESIAERPQDGDDIIILGGLMDYGVFPMIIVYEINGETWRDSSSFGPYFGGGWMHSDMTDSMRFHAPFDNDDWMMVQPGWHGGMGHGHGGGGGMMPDSIFAQILELFPENMPEGPGNNGTFAGYEMGMFYNDGSNGMWQDSGCGSHMEFNNNIQMQFHYNDIQLLGNNIDENTVMVKYWDENTTSWEEVPGAVYNPENNSVTFSSNEVSNFYILTGEQSITSTDNQEAAVARKFVLLRNYPNPFNPGTTIQFTLEKPAKVRLSVYNVLGQFVKELANSEFNAGLQSIYFDASSLASGVYFVELNVNNQKYYHKVQLLR